MINHRGFTIIFTLLFLTSANAMAAKNMQEGQWKMSVQMEMPGMPMQMPKVTYHKCMTKKNTVPQRDDSNQNCKMGKNSVKGDTVTWHMECKDKGGSVTFDGKVTYKGKTMEGTIKINRDGRQMLQRISGQWVGQCK